MQIIFSPTDSFGYPIDLPFSATWSLITASNFPLFSVNLVSFSRDFITTPNHADPLTQVPQDQQVPSTHAMHNILTISFLLLACFQTLQGAPTDGRNRFSGCEKIGVTEPLYESQSSSCATARNGNHNTAYERPNIQHQSQSIQTHEPHAQEPMEIPEDREAPKESKHNVFGEAVTREAKEKDQCNNNCRKLSYMSECLEGCDTCCSNGFDACDQNPECTILATFAACIAAAGWRMV